MQGGRRAGTRSSFQGMGPTLETGTRSMGRSSQPTSPAIPTEVAGAAAGAAPHFVGQAVLARPAQRAAQNRPGSQTGTNLVETAHGPSRLPRSVPPERSRSPHEIQALRTLPPLPS